MLRDIVFLIAAMMLIGCVSTNVDRKYEDTGLVKTLRFGVALSTSESGQVFVNEVANGSPAQKAGLKAGDELLSVGGHSIRKRSDFIYARSTAEANVVMVFQVSRQGKVMTLEVKPGYQNVLSCAAKIRGPAI